MTDNVYNYEFENREAFRRWLEQNHTSSEGIWITLTKGSKDFSANDALEEAVCFGWIDGVLKSIDTAKYMKYFSKRKNKTKWSEKNKAIYKSLKEQGLVTKYGEEAYQVDEKNVPGVNKEDMNTMRILKLKEVLRDRKEILRLFEDTSTSKQKQFAGFYCEAKTETTREKRKAKIIEALMTDYKGMLY